MFKHNFIISFRRFNRYKMTFLINLMSLSTGIACAILIFLWVKDELNVDKFHENDSRLYQVMENVNQDNKIITRQSTAGPTAEALANEMPEVEYAVTTTTNRILSYILSFDENNIRADGLYAGPDFFKLFSYQLIRGSKEEVLSDKKSIVISESLAERLFGTTEDVMGKVVEWQHEKQYKVTGIFKDIPARSSVQFDFVLTIETFKDNNGWFNSWFNTAPQTYLLMKSGTDINRFNSKIANLIRIKTNNEADHRTPFITRYSDVYLYNHYENGIQAGGRIDYVRMFSIIAIFLLLIACINFMNLSTARASGRMKEVGIKKTIGAGRRILISQYLGESIIMATLSLIISVILVILILPKFNLITGKHLVFGFDMNLVLSLLGIAIITGVMAGSYPALYLSGVRPISVLKGKLSSSIGELWVRKGLVVFQFAISVIFIVSVLVVYKQIEFVQAKNLGYDKNNVLLIEREGQLSQEANLETFLSEVNTIPGVIDASSTGHDMRGHNGGTYGIVWPGKDPEDKTEFENMPVNYGMIGLLGIKMKEGRTFSKKFSADTAKIIFNDAAIQFMGLTDPIGKVIKLWGRDMQIIGVTENFHFETFHEKVKPAFFWLSSQNTDKIAIKINAGSVQKTIAGIQQLHRKLNPGFPLDYQFLDDEYQALYAAEQRVSVLSKYFAGLAVLISCMGLFGLAAFTAERRTKEIGIRKILGAEEFGIIRMLSGEFTKIVLIAILCGLPVSYLIIRNWLNDFAYRIDLKWWYFVGAGMLALLIAWLTVGIQTFKAARINPVKCLQDE